MLLVGLARIILCASFPFVFVSATAAIMISGEEAAAIECRPTWALTECNHGM